MIRHELLSIGFNRPKMMKLSMEHIERALTDDVHWYLYQDGCEKFDSDQFNVEGHIQRKAVLGISKNILTAIQEAFEVRNAQIVTIVESDVLVSKDFIKFVKEAMRLKDKSMFTVSGYSILKGQHPADHVWGCDWYFPWGVSFDRSDYDLIQPHINNSYFKDNSAYLKAHFEAPLRRTDWGCWQYAKFLPRHPLQAGLIHNIRVLHGRKQLVPMMSRCQNIGVYGANQIQKTPDKTDVRNEQEWMRSQHYAPTWTPDQDFKELRVVEVGEEALKDTTMDITPWKKKP